MENLATGSASGVLLLEHLFDLMRTRKDGIKVMVFTDGELIKKKAKTLQDDANL